MSHPHSIRPFVPIVAAALAAAALATPSVATAETRTTATLATVDIDAELDRLVEEERNTDLYPVPSVYEPPLVSIDELDRDLIARVQEGLKRLGYPIGRADGIVGPPTRMSLNAFLAAKDWPKAHALNDDVLRDLGIPIDEVQ